MSELKSFEVLLEEFGEARFDCGLLINTNKDGYNEAVERADQLQAELITALNRRAPEAGQQKPYGYEEFFAEADGLTVKQFMSDWKRARPQDFETQAQAEPVAERKPTVVLDIKHFIDSGSTVINYRQIADLSEFDEGEYPLYTQPQRSAEPKDGKLTPEQVERAKESLINKCVERFHKELSQSQRAAVPADPTEAMLIAARDWSYAKYGKPIGNDSAIGCWQAMLAAAPEHPKAAPDETAWLVEDSHDNGAIRYRTMDQTGIHWTTDANQAIRFSRRADAEMFAAGDEDAWHVVEHMWCAAPEQQEG